MNLNKEKYWFFFFGILNWFDKCFSWVLNWKMDPDSVKSTLSNLAFGNVMAAAARDYQKVALRSITFSVFVIAKF